VFVEVVLVEATLEVVDPPPDLVDAPPEVASKVDAVFVDVAPEVVEPEPLEPFKARVRALRAF